MHVIRLNCNACGAPLQVPAKANFVTCAFCSAQLAVRRTEGAITTEALEAIAQGTQKLTHDVETIKLQNELERLDREWTLGMQKYKMRGEVGHYSLPSSLGSILAGALGVGFGIFWLAITTSFGAPGFFPLFGFLFIGMAVLMAVSGCMSATAYENARRDYESSRRRMLHDIHTRAVAPGRDGRAA